MSILAAFFLVAGAGICLVAALGVLRLPDFFLRMHAATTAGVAGCSLVLIGVGFAAPSLGMWIKIAIAIAFLLLTTPLAGHLLGRAGYLAGVPLWDGTLEDQLGTELKRGDFERPAASTGSPRTTGDAAPGLRRVIVALASGPHTAAAVEQAVALARRHQAELTGLAIIDQWMLRNVGPVPIGASYHAQQLRNLRVGQARRAAADCVQIFEQAAQQAGVRFKVELAEGDPFQILSERHAPDALLLLGGEAWFDHGVARKTIDPLMRLARRDVGPIVGIAGEPRSVRRIGFLHDGSAHSEQTLRWLLDLDPWPEAELCIEGESPAHAAAIASARELAIARGRRLASVPQTDTATSQTQQLADCEVIVFGNERNAGLLRRLTPGSRRPRPSAPIVVFG